MAYTRRSRTSVRRRTPARRVNRTNYGRKRRSPVRRVSRGRSARPQTLRIVIEQPGDVGAARPEITGRPVETTGKKAKF